jgi:UDP-glucose 4-epimerase
LSVFPFLISQLNPDLVLRLRDFYGGKSAVVTGGASFIGSNLVDCLLALDCRVLVIDDLSSGNVKYLTKNAQLGFMEKDLRNPDGISHLFVGADLVFHLAAIHGGRGFIETYTREMLANLVIDNFVFSAAVIAKVKNIVHASSACAYPVDLQKSEIQLNLLAEAEGSMDRSDACFADGVYGWTKLFGEYQLKNFVSGSMTKGRSARIFTSYGDRENESHAAIALIAKALLKADPFPIWGSGEQTRNFTYVSDTVTGLLLLGSDARTINFDVFNIGTSDHVKVIDFVKEIFSNIGWEPNNLDLQFDKPVGVASRASDNTKIRENFGWQPSVSIKEGVSRTIEWYKKSGTLPKNLEELEARLMAR